MSQTTIQQQLQHILQQELDLTSQLLKQLDGERQAISEKEADRLTQLAAEKQHQLTALQHTTKQREALLIEHGLPVSRDGMEQLISTLNTPAIQSLWDNLTNSAEQCQEQNRQLGMLIQREQNSVQQAQHILQRGTPNKPVAYNATGSTDNASKTRPLGKA